MKGRVLMSFFIFPILKSTYCVFSIFELCGRSEVSRSIFIFTFYVHSRAVTHLDRESDQGTVRCHIRFEANVSEYEANVSKYEQM